jgi:hypothetical protein
MRHIPLPGRLGAWAVLTAVLSAACLKGAKDVTGLVGTPDSFQFTAKQLGALDSSATAVARSNPTNPDLAALVDSTFMVLTVGVKAVHVVLNTDLTANPLYFIGIHRAMVNAAGASWSTWTLVGMDDSLKLSNLIEVSGFAQNASASVPESVSGTIGDGTGIVNGNFWQVGATGTATQWHAGLGTASFTSDTTSAPGAPCPGFTNTPKVTCSIEAMDVHFSLASSMGTLGSHTASVPVNVGVPAMRLTYTQ